MIGSGRWIPVVVAVCALLVVAGGAWWLRMRDPAVGGGIAACRFHALTGWQCPGCGMTRATHHLLNGRLGRAFYFNALYVAMSPGLLLWGAWWVRHWWSEKPMSARARRANAWLGGMVLAAWLVFWLVRNTSAWPLL